MAEPQKPKRGGTRPGAGRKPRNETAGNTYTFRFSGSAEALLLAQLPGQRNAYVEAALLAYRPE